MAISALLSPQKIFIDTEVSSKKKLLELIANITADQTRLPESTIYTNLLNRERLGSTGLGQGIALPHARVAGVTSACGAFLQLAGSADFDAIDGYSKSHKRSSNT